MQKNKKLALNSEIQTNQILTNNYEVCIPSLSSILIAVRITEATKRLFYSFETWAIAEKFTSFPLL